MYSRKLVLSLCILSIVSIPILDCPAAAERGAMHLKFSLEPEPVTVTVSGRVTDRESGEPIAEALVRGHVVIWRHQGPDLFEKCPYQETGTDANGIYQLQFETPLTTSGPMKGKDGLCVYVSAAGYETVPKYGKPRVTPENTDYPGFDFELSPGQLIKGVVVDDHNSPVEAAIVRLQGGSNGDWDFFGATGETVTGANGSFELWISKGRGRWLNISKQGYGPVFFWDYLTTGDMGTVKLPPGGSIAGKVVDADGKGVANCELAVWRYPCGLIDKVLTDQQGNYVLRGLPGDPSIIEFYKQKNKTYRDEWGKVTVYACLDPRMKLQNVPQYEIMAQDGKTITGPELVVGSDTSVLGRLIASKATFALGGLMVRLDHSWDNMVEADAQGSFYFPLVSPGKHRLTAYLPHNLRYDRGIGHIDIEVERGRPLEDLQIQLDDLAEVRVQYLDADGNPISGITVGATWSISGDGAWTEGTKSDEDGWAVLYMYPDSVQYVRGFDHSGNLAAEGFKRVEPKAGQVMENLQIVMVPTAGIRGRLLNEQKEPISETVLLCKLDFADGFRKSQRIKTDAAGRFEIIRLTPGVVTMSMEIDSVLFDDVLGRPVEIRPGTTKDLSDVVLRQGLDKEQMIQQKHAHATEHPDEIVQAAEELFEKIRRADYDHFLKDNADWHDFPIVGYYQTHHWFDVLVKWMSKTFKENPIVGVELGEVFENPEVINDKKGLPTVPYKVTMQDGTVLQGNLPFEFNFDRDVAHWHGLHGIDWHLQDGSSSQK
jgi:protocatechuate 3,4-dioxygenase beta subunit